MIEYCYEISFRLADEKKTTDWIKRVIESEGRQIEELSYVFCDDERLLELNQKFLNHDTYTDILTFPYSDSDDIHADIFISVPRVKENSVKFGSQEEEELRRVMVHGVLHLLGYDDHGDEARNKMRELENSKLKMFHVEQ